MTKKVRRYTKEFKDEAIKLALKSKSVNKVASELGIPGPTLHTWIKQLKATADESFADTPHTSQSITSLLEENRRLHKELSIAREEKEILKKAAAYFAQHQK